MYQSTPTQEKKMLKQVLDRSTKVDVQSKVGQLPTYIIRPDDLTDDEKTAVFNAVYFVGLSAFIQNPSTAMEEDIAEHLFSEDVLVVTFSNEIDWRNIAIGSPRAIAFLGYRDIQVEDKNMLYISGICVDPSYQGNGIGSALMSIAYERGDYQITSLRTQNPVMKQAFDKTIGGSSHPNGVKIPQDIKAIGILLAKTFGAKNYDANSLRCHKAYGSSLYGLEINSNNSDYLNTKFNSIDRDEGDALFCIKRV